MTAKILVLGGAHIDRRGRIEGETAAGASNPGSWFEEPGGGGFNAARNLARLGFAVRLISPRGGDATGEAVAAAALNAGVEDCPFVFLDRKTPSYTAILERDGNLVIALADMDLYRLFTPRRLQVRAVREAIEDADLVLCDGNLPEETLTALARLVAGLGKPLAAIAISPAKVVRLKNALPDIDYLFMNEAEAAALTGIRPDNAGEWPDLLRRLGLKGGAITRGGREIIAFSGNQAASLVPPAVDTIADVTGAGDSFASGMLSAVLRGLPLTQAMRHGAAAAAITLQSPFATADDLSEDRLESKLTEVPDARILP